MLVSQVRESQAPPGARAPAGQGNGHVPPARSPWLGLHRPAQTQLRARLIVLPFAGGNASAFFPWTKEIGGEEWLEIAVLQPPGRGARFREPPVDSLEVYADAVAGQALELARGHGEAPLFLMGYSMGALVAYLTARDQAHRLPLAHLIVAARRAPVRQNDVPPSPRLSRDQVFARLERLQGTPEALLRNPELLEPYLDSISAEFHLVDSWSDDRLPGLDVDVTAYAGLDDPETAVNDVFEWSELTTRDFAAHFLPGGHFFMNTARPTFCRLVRQMIEATLGGDAG